MTDASFRGEGRHLLVIDDEPEIVAALRRQFRRKYRVLTAHGAAEGHEIMVFRDLQRSNEILEERVRERTAELEAANQRLEALNRQKDEFVGIAAHDLRSPLASILGLIGMMIDSPRIQEEGDLHEMFRMAKGMGGKRIFR